MLLSLALGMAIPGLALDDPPRMIDGIARYAGTDRPAAGLTLRIVTPADPHHAVTADAQGRFRLPWPPDSPAPQPDGVEESCEAVPEPEGRWHIEPFNTPPFHSSPEQLRESVARTLSRHARAIWRKNLLVVECPEPGEVDVLVRGVDGKPLADRPVEVVPGAATFQSVGPVNARFTGRTDASGHFRMRWFAGAKQLHVTAPGEGACSTPIVQVAAGKTVSVETLPMGRLGSISGRLAPELAGPGVSVVLDPEALKPTPCDADGRFLIRDVPPGRYELRLRKGDQGARSGQITAWVAPGGEVDGLVFEAIPPPTPEEIADGKKMLEQLNGRRGPGDKDELWVEGTVRDASGRPLGGVDVFVRSAYHGGMRMYEDVRRTATDANGHYAISGPIHTFVEGLVVIAKAKGHPPALADAEARSARNDRPAKLDLTLADAGGSASVAVVGDGKPLAGVKVRLKAEGGADIRFGLGWARGETDAARVALDAILTPTAETGRDGVARFTELLPGLYRVQAGGQARDLPVAPGREARATVSPTSFQHDVAFQVIRPDGRPVANQSVSLQFGPGGRGNGFANLKLDGQGIGSYSFGSAGLWTVVVRFRDEPIHSFPLYDPPYDEAEMPLAVSPALRSSGPVRLVGSHREPRSDSLRVRLLDVDGRPARGVVEFAGATGSTDERGEIRFDGLSGQPPGTRPFVSGVLEGPAPPPWPSAGRIPGDDALRGPFALVPRAEVALVPGRDEAVELRARPVGYLRGKFLPAAGRSPGDYRIFPGYDPRVLEPNSSYVPETNEFVAGPFLAGPVTLRFSTRMPDGEYRNCGKQVVEVVPGAVVHADLRPGEPEAVDRRAARRQTMLGMGGISVNPGAPEAAPPAVFLPDGVTPAFAAQAVLFVPDREQPAGYGISDGSGRLTWRGMWVGGGQEDRPKAGLVDRPTLVVSLPGRHGAAIVPLVEDGPAQRVVLPPAIDAEGTVTVGGRAPRDDGSQIRVVAAYQGRGVLDAALGLKTTSGPDGRFSLAGLTPGRYRVQAARDGIWVSKAVEVVVEPGKAIPPMSLEIPPPGELVTLEIVDRAGRPLAGESFTLARPEGPFAALWPATLRADASGRLTLPGLEAGMHTVSIAGTSEAWTFQVGEATDLSGRPAVRRVVLQRPGP